MRRRWFSIALQVFGIALVGFGLVRNAMASTGPCKVNVQWDEQAQTTYSILNTDGSPSCVHQGCPSEGDTCESVVLPGGYACRCSNTPLVSATACELRVVFTGPPYACVGGAIQCRTVSASCVNVSCMGTCPPLSNKSECWDAAGLGQCPACR